jgi:hypothetical protein
MGSKNEVIKLVERMNQPNKRLQKKEKVQGRNSNSTDGKNHIWKYCRFNFQKIS